MLSHSNQTFNSKGWLDYTRTTKRMLGYVKIREYTVVRLIETVYAKFKISEGRKRTNFRTCNLCGDAMRSDLNNFN